MLLQELPDARSHGLAPVGIDSILYKLIQLLELGLRDPDEDPLKFLLHMVSICITIDIYWYLIDCQLTNNVLI